MFDEESSLESCDGDFGLGVWAKTSRNSFSSSRASSRSAATASGGETIRFSFKSIERWLYIARAANDPFTALARKVLTLLGSEVDPEADKHRRQRRRATPTTRLG